MTLASTPTDLRDRMGEVGGRGGRGELRGVVDQAARAVPDPVQACEQTRARYHSSLNICIYTDSPYKREWGRENDGRTSSKQAVPLVARVAMVELKHALLFNSH